MDVPLYAIALVVFAVLYLGIGVFLAYTLAITLIIMFVYLALRHGTLPENYPHGLGDTMITVIFIGVTWGIFTYLAPKSPIPFLPGPGQSGLLYSTNTVVPFSSFLVISLVLAMVFLVIGAFVAKDLRGAVSGTTTSAHSSALTPQDQKPKQGVGS
jgi:hypothetical protein